MKHYLLIFILIVPLLIGVSCSDTESCRTETDIAMKALFYDQESGKSSVIDSITVYGLGKDSLLYNNAKNAGNISLPLNNSGNSSVFVIHFNDEVYDTINVQHTNTDYFISYACGFVVTHNIDTVLTTNHFIKEIKINNHDVNLADAQHIQIFH